jgi:hypothetical protein
MLVPGGLCCIAIVSSRIASRPVVITGFWASFIDSSRASIGENHGNLTFFAWSAILHLHGGVLPGGCQTTAEVDGWVGFAALLVYSILRQIDSESHLAIVDGAPVLYGFHITTKALDRG